jgi:hypothetical protein
MQRMLIAWLRRVIREREILLNGLAGCIDKPPFKCRAESKVSLLLIDLQSCLEYCQRCDRSRKQHQMNATNWEQNCQIAKKTQIIFRSDYLSTYWRAVCDRRHSHTSFVYYTSQDVRKGWFWSSLEEGCWCCEDRSAGRWEGPSQFRNTNPTSSFSTSPLFLSNFITSSPIMSADDSVFLDIVSDILLREKH